MSYNVRYILEEDFIAGQSAAERLMLKEFEEGDYTIGSPLVKLNPYIISPCAAVILFRTKEETAVTVTVRGKVREADISHTFPKAKTHILPVLGLYPGYDNTVDIELYQGGGNTIKIKTAEKAPQAAELIHMSTSAEYLRGDLIFVTPAGSTGRLTGFDFRGDIRWYSSLNIQMGLKRLGNGRILIGTNRNIASPYYTTGLYEMDLAGKIYKEYLIPGGYHHDQAEIPGGDILVLSNDRRRGTVEDVCLLIDADTGAVKKTWDMKDVINPGDGKSGLATGEDWFHGNSVWYDKNTNSISLSGRHVDAIVNLDFDDGSLNWIIGDLEGWSEEKQKYFFEPEDKNSFGWQYAQHAASVLPDGDVLCFDNGTKRSKNKEKYIRNQDNYSRAVRFKIDKDNMTIKQIWEYGRELGSDFFSQHISNVDCCGDNHYLVHSGGIQFYNGITPDTLIGAFDPSARCESATVCLIEGSTVLDMRVKGNYYRAKKLSLYHNSGANLCIGDGKKLGALAAAERAELPPAAASAEPLPESCFAHIIENDESICLKARFEANKRVYVVLEQGGSLLGYKVSAGGRFSRFSCAPYIEEDDNNTSTLISKTGLSGIYSVKLLIESQLFETGVNIAC